MNKSYFYFIGIFFLVLVFGFMMVKGNSLSQDEVVSAVLKEGYQEVRLGLKDYNYYPNAVKVKAGIPVRVYLDQSVVGCLRDFTVRDFGIHEYLQNPDDYIEFMPEEKGKHTFACSMGMGTGVLIVE